MSTTTSPPNTRPGLRARWGRRAWSLAEAMASPRDPGDYLDLFHPLRRSADLRARVCELRPEAAGAVTLRFLGVLTPFGTRSLVALGINSSRQGAAIHPPSAGRIA